MKKPVCSELKKDELTSLYAPEAIKEYAETLIQNNVPFSFALVDIDNYTYILDTFGETGGKMALCGVAEKLSFLLGGRGIVGRYEGDEFVVILENIVSYDEIWNFCHNVLVKINEIELPGIGNLTLTVTIGLDRFPENAKSYPELLECAEKALSRGKAKGRNCFIIYLPEKHASIVPRTDKGKALGSINLHSSLFRFLTATNDLSNGIVNLINFLSSYFEIDHICIQSETKILFQKIHQLAQNKEFSYIPNELIRLGMNKSMEMFYLSDTKSLLRSRLLDLYDVFHEQNVTSTCFCEISYQNEHFGMLRADMTGNGNDRENRFWQYSDMDLFLTAAKTIGLILHFTGTSLDDL